MSYRNMSVASRTGEQGMVLTGVSFKGEIRGVCLEATVEQRFVNPGESHLEAVYSLPLPWGAVVLEVEATLGDRHLKGAVVARGEAEARYENAIADGDVAIMVERNHDGSCCMNLGNLAPGESCTIRLRYAQLLQFEQGGLRLLVPTVIAPRYGDPVLQGGLKPHQAPEHSLTAEYPFQLEIDIHGPLARGAVSSPSHAVTIQFHPGWDSDRMNVTLARHGFLDRDFILVIGGIAHNSVAIQARDCVEPDRAAVLVSFCPRVSSQEASLLAVKLLVDCSGSMAGDSIGAARRALQSIVALLTNGDRFSLSRFGSTVEHRSRGLWNLTDATRVAAQRWVNNLEADLGGTEMEGALQSTFELSNVDTGSDVLLVTDGEIHGIDSTVERARTSGHRLFVVGIGSSPAEIHLRRLAEATGGACDFVAPGEAVEPAILRMFHRLRSPRLTQVTVRWPQEKVPIWQTPVPVSVFDGDMLSVFALLDQPLEGEVTLIGSTPSGGEQHKIGAVPISGPPADLDSVSRLAAAEQIRTSSEPQRLAVAYQLLTDHTSFLMVYVRNETEKARDMPGVHKVQQMMPAGWGGMGSVERMPRLKSCSIDIGDMDVPAMLRRADTSLDQIYFSRRLEERKLGYSGSTGKSYASRRDELLQSDPGRYLVAADSFWGLTPLGAQTWLRLTPADQWPCSYQELVEEMGFGDWLVEWLELTIGTRFLGQWDESDIVSAFLQVIVDWEMPGDQDIDRPVGLMARLRSLFRDAPKPADNPLSDELKRVIKDGLTGLAPSDWPDQVFAMET